MIRRPTLVPIRASSPWRSLSLSLLLWLMAIVILAFTAYAVLNIRTTSQQWRENLEAGALRFSELIKQSTHYSMMLNRKEDVRHIIRTIGQEAGVAGVRVYDKQGVIIYSADEAEIGTRVDLQAEACIVCHERDQPLRSVPSGERVRVYRGASGERVLGLINPIENTASCSGADCHAHPSEQTVLGVLDVKMSMAEADERLATTERLSITAAVAMALAVGLASAVFINLFVQRPVQELIEGTERIAQGDLDTTLDPHYRNEIGQLAVAFNQMTRDLRQAQRENEEWSRKLEQKVVEKTEELTRTQRQVVHMEKMASLGKLAATVAHELNNPLAGILNYAKLVDRSLREGVEGREEKEELERFLALIQRESSRCGEIVRNLLDFARRSGGEFALHRLGAVTERALMVVRHLLEMSGVEQETELAAADDELVCDANQLQQALVALFVNAAEAMGEGGTLRVAVASADDALTLVVSDTGTGIPDEALPHIFEPFYSTKEHGNGAGLGLAVVYGIVQRHGGTIEVQSRPGEGATFRITLPRHPPAGAVVAAAGSEV